MSSGNQTTTASWVATYAAFHFQMMPRAKDISRVIILYSFPVSIVIGIFGNSLSLAIMATPQMRRHSYAYYVMSLAVYDNVTLAIYSVSWMNTLSFELFATLVFEMKHIFACRLADVVLDFCLMGSSYTIVIMSLERLVVVTIPIKSRLICTPKTARIVCFCFSLASLTTQTYLNVTVIEYGAKIGCYVTPELVSLTFIISPILYKYFPMLSIMLINLLIIQKLIATRNFGTGGQKQAQSRRTTIMLSSVAAAYVIFMLPSAVVSDWLERNEIMA
ncbi:uncharacterized protein LOC141903480 [Tubulanus polymorphus]|uniref:uncharacterized protein LOC141903480 n=1 Tax=Tubulanus polymorphus TaxID=672921 RepID=UPI003DA34BFB